MTEPTSGWALLPLPGAVTAASYLTGSLAKQYRLIVDILDDQRSATLTGVGFDELAALIRGRLPDEHARELLDELALDSRMRQLVEWGTCTSWQDRAESQEDFLRNRYRYQLTEAGSQINAAARAIDAELGTTSTAVLLAPAAIVDRLRGTLEALRVDDPVAAANEFSQVRHTLDAMSAAASEWQTRLAAALGGSPTEAKVTRLLETILAYADAWGSGVDAWTDTIAGLLPDVTGIDDAHWHAMALVRLGSKATADALAATVEEMRGDVDRLALWFTAPTLQAARLRRQIRDAVTPVLRSHRALLAVGGTVSRKADLLRLAGAIEAAPSDDDAWQIWCTATGLYSARHVADEAPEITDPAHVSAWDAPPVSLSRRLRTQGPRSLSGRPPHIVDRRTAREEARRRAQRERADVERAAATLASHSGMPLRDWPPLSAAESELLLDMIAAARNHVADDGTSHAISPDGRWNLRYHPADGSAVIDVPDGRIVLADGIVEFGT
ncbi:MAG: DUF2397 domain-containing protein [Propionibacterium sp.]|nr:DUF2397 domain-containing protein [Propionibacterium sp.]